MFFLLCNLVTESETNRAVGRAPEGSQQWGLHVSVFVIWYLKGALSGSCVFCFREVAALLSLAPGRFPGHSLSPSPREFTDSGHDEQLDGAALTR